MANQNKSMGQLMREDATAGWRNLAIGAGVIVYIGGVLYGEARNFFLFSRTIDVGSVAFIGAIIGLVSMGITALTLPIAVKYWTMGIQRWAALALYAFDIFVMALNAVIDAGLHEKASISSLDPILQMWFLYVFPALPLVMLAGWAMIFFLDPEQKQRDMAFKVHMATLQAMWQSVLNKADTDIMDKAIDGAATEFFKDHAEKALGYRTQTRAVVLDNPQQKGGALPPARPVEPLQRTPDNRQPVPVQNQQQAKPQQQQNNPPKPGQGGNNGKSAKPNGPSLRDGITLLPRAPFIKVADKDSKTPNK
jgi:hypothetical protein